MKRNDIGSFAETWTDLESVTQSEESQKKKNDNQVKMLQEIFNIVYSDDNYEKQVKQVRDVLLGKGE